MLHLGYVIDKQVLNIMNIVLIKYVFMNGKLL